MFSFNLFYFIYFIQIHVGVREFKSNCEFLIKKKISELFEN